MTTLLRIDASARIEGSHSRALADEVQAAWLEQHADGRVIVRDLAADPVALIHNDTIKGYFTPTEQMTDELRRATALSDALIAELRLADSLLISTPMYNFGIPAVLKAWVDQVVRVNHTFHVDPQQGLTGLLKNKTAYVTVAMGAQFTGTEMESLDQVRPYLRTVLGFIGFEKVEFFSVESTNLDEQKMQATRQAALKQIQASVNAVGSVAA